MLLFANQGDTSKVEKSREEDNSRNIEGDLEVPDAQRTKTKVTSIRNGYLSSMNDVVVMMANAIGFGPLIVIPQGRDEKKTPVIIAIIARLYLFTKSKRFQKWEARFTEQQPQFFIIFFKTLDSVFNIVASFAQHSSNITYSLEKKIDKLSKDGRLNEAVYLAWMFEKEVKNKIAMDSYYSDVPRITPDKYNPTMLFKAAAKSITREKARPASATIAGTPAKPAKAPKTAKESTPSGTAKEKPDPKTRGFFVPGEGCTPAKIFEGITASDGNAKTPCYYHHAVGLECTTGWNACKYLHGSCVRFHPDVRKKILENMKKNKCAHFNPELKSSERFKAAIGSGYDSLWPDAPAEHGA